jgi:hypothetical protein
MTIRQGLEITLCELLQIGKTAGIVFGGIKAFQGEIGYKKYNMAWSFLLNSAILE